MRLQSGTWLLLCTCALALGANACGETKKAAPADAGGPPDSPAGTGGTATGGMVGTGGGSGGSSGQGGASAGVGGGTASGGVVSTGGTASTGGVVGTGGASVGTGGIVADGAAGTGGILVGTGGTVVGTGGTGVTPTGGAGGIATGGMSGGSAGGSGGGAGGVVGRGGSGGAGPGGASGPLALCPATQPASGSACAGPYGDSGTCTWGDSPRPECRTRGSCNSGAWILGGPAAYCAGLAAACPSAVPEQSSVCADTSLQCMYSGGNLCRCTPCTGMALGDPPPFCLGQPLGTPLWDCTGAWALPAECPATVPNRGASCSVDSTIGCPFDNCGGLNVYCTGGIWTWTYPPVDCFKSWCASKCSVCASPDTPIATPEGDRPIADLRVGDLVYSVEDGAIVPVPILRTSRTAVSGHHVVRVQAADGRVLELSPGHPTADGRRFADLRAGTHLDGAAIASAHLVPYQHPYTYDILPMSRSGTYFAAGMLIGTTLK